MRTISTPDAPKPFGHYSQAVVHAGMVYVAGMLPIDPVTGTLVPGDISVQTERTLRNVEAVLEAAGSDLKGAAVYCSMLVPSGSPAAADHGDQEIRQYWKGTHDPG